MSRFTFGPTVGAVTLVAPAAKTDIAVTYSGVTPQGVFSFGIPAYDPTTTNQLLAIHVGLFVHQTDFPGDPSNIVSAPYHAASNVGTLASGGVVTVDASSSPAGSFFALVVLEFAQ